MTCRRLITLLVCLAAGNDRRRRAGAPDAGRCHEPRARAQPRHPHRARGDRPPPTRASSPRRATTIPQLRIESGTSWRADAGHLDLLRRARRRSGAAPIRACRSTASLSQLFKTGAVATFTSSVVARQHQRCVHAVRPRLHHLPWRRPAAALAQESRHRSRPRSPPRDGARSRRGRAPLSPARCSTRWRRWRRAYWALVAARRDLDVRRGSLALAEQQRADTQVRIEAQTVPVSDLAQPTAEVERRRGDLFAAQEARRARRARAEAADPRRRAAIRCGRVETVPTDRARR